MAETNEAARQPSPVSVDGLLSALSSIEGFESINGLTADEFRGMAPTITHAIPITVTEEEVSESPGPLVDRIDRQILDQIVEESIQALRARETELETTEQATGDLPVHESVASWIQDIRRNGAPTEEAAPEEAMEEAAPATRRRAPRVAPAASDDFFDELVRTVNPAAEIPLPDASSRFIDLSGAIENPEPVEKKVRKKKLKVAETPIPIIEITQETSSVNLWGAVDELILTHASGPARLNRFKPDDKDFDDYERLYGFSVAARQQWYPRATDSRINVVIVGCGGTGSRLIPMIAQHAATTQTLAEIFLIDPDHVEMKNLMRQGFFEFEVGTNKAVAMAERFNLLFGLDIKAINGTFQEFLDDADMTQNLAPNQTIIFDCTDNKSARESIEFGAKGDCFNPASGKTLMQNNLNTAILVSCGNERDFGQVMISRPCNPLSVESRLLNSYAGAICNQWSSNRSRINQWYGADGGNTLNWLPGLLVSNRNFVDSGTNSCVELSMEEQSMPINSLVAQLAYNVFHTLINRKVADYNLVRCNVSNQFSTEYINTFTKLRKLYAKATYGPQYQKYLDKFDKLGIMLSLYQDGTDFYTNTRPDYVAGELILPILQKLDRLPSHHRNYYNHIRYEGQSTKMMLDLCACLSKDDLCAFYPLIKTQVSLGLERGKPTDAENYIKLLDVVNSVEKEMFGR